MDVFVVWEPIPVDYRHPTLENWELEEIRQLTSKFLQRQLPNMDLTYDATLKKKSEVLACALGMFLMCETHDQLQLSWIEVLDFILDVQEGYKDNPYHSFKHAIDVTFVLYHFLISYDASRFFQPLDSIILLISAITHDILHPGLNNLYQVNGKTDLSLLYGDKSVLEKYSISHALSLIRKHNLLRNLPDDEIQNFNKALEKCVLSTDMVCHFDLMSEFENMVCKLLGVVVGDSTCTECRIDDAATSAVTIKLPLDHDHRQVLMKFLLHGADISNPCRPWPLCKKWSDLVVHEFFLQGDVEKKYGLPISPNMDRDSSNQIEISLGFGDIIVKPYFEMLAQFIPETKELVQLLDLNRQMWIELKARSKSAKNLLNHSKVDEKTSNESSTDPVSAQSRHPPDSPLIPDSVQNLRSNILGRRLSVAAGVITVPENLPQMPKNSRKISFEYGNNANGDNVSQSSSKNSSVRHSTATLHSVLRVRVGDGKQGETKSAMSSTSELERRFGSLGFESSSNTNESGASYEHVSRRTSAVSTDDESGLLKFMMKRRNSHLTNASSNSSLPQSESFIKSRSDMVISNMSRESSFVGHKRASRHSRDSSTERGGDDDEKIVNTLPEEGRDVDSLLEISMLVMPNASSRSSKSDGLDDTGRPPEHIMNPRRLSRPQSYLHHVVAETKNTSLKNMMLRSRIENIMLPRDMPNKESVLASFIPTNDPYGKYRTIHRSDKIHDYLMRSRRKNTLPIWLLYSAGDDYGNQGECKAPTQQLSTLNSVHFVHAGDVQVASKTKTQRTSSAGAVIQNAGDSGIGGGSSSKSRSDNTAISQENLELFARVAPRPAVVEEVRRSSQCEVQLKHRRAISEGLVVDQSILQKLKNRLSRK